MNRYSFTSIEKYKTCGFSFKLHYLDKIRPIEEPSTFSFGSAIDKAIGALLVPGEKSPEEVFLEEWTATKILTSAATFSKSDLDPDLLPDRDPGMQVSENLLAFLSLKQKGLLFIKAFREKVMPKIKSVKAIQKPISLVSQDGSSDEFIGFIDFVAEIEGYDKPVILDLKTSSVKYAPDSVKKSPQLTIYTYAAGQEYGTNLAGFVVLNKKIVKIKNQTCTKCGNTELNSRKKTCDKEVKGVRCHGDWETKLTFDVNVDIIVDEITDAEENEVLSVMDKVHEDIKVGVFEQNFQSCVHPIYRKKCPYYALCHEGKMDGLKILKGDK